MSDWCHLLTGSGELPVRPIGLSVRNIGLSVHPISLSGLIENKANSAFPAGTGVGAKAGSGN